MGECDPNYKDAQYAYYRYDPNTGAAVLFIILFSMTTILHMLQMIKTKTWYMAAFVGGGLCEVVGYIGRAIGAGEEPGCWSLGAFVIQSVLILIGPALMAASIYMILGRIILLTEGELYSPIRRRWLTKLFVGGDILALLAQSSGGGIMSSDDGFETGEKVIIIGLYIQLCFFGTFVLVSGLFHWRMRRAPTATAAMPHVRWEAYLRAIYVASGLVWVRSAFRVIEYHQGNGGYLISHEVWIYLFDALLMFGTMVWLNWYHPAEIGILLRGEMTTAKNGLELVGLNLPLGRRSSSKGTRISNEALA
ncbi:RTM1 [Verticillium alfalfae VaMs.102]|uniref:RTM1 n=1 Tax=Verticillium alfalfae (strain VaMs.102 / ATCC MYA-4576 / FGSC 10136) TaxID=526221 RepID=C9SSI1_VERA1|nr:RTM1 [Verticillium alfalfae VaMs.102]EEY21746.1 RTM1 [Verticillium alfalfae VaMs.102]